MCMQMVVYMYMTVHCVSALLTHADANAYVDGSVHADDDACVGDIVYAYVCVCTYSLTDIHTDMLTSMSTLTY